MYETEIGTRPNSPLHEEFSFQREEKSIHLHQIWTVQEYQGSWKRIQKRILPKEPMSNSDYPCIHKNNILQILRGPTTCREIFIIIEPRVVIFGTRSYVKSDED